MYHTIGIPNFIKKFYFTQKNDEKSNNLMLSDTPMSDAVRATALATHCNALIILRR